MASTWFLQCRDAAHLASLQGLVFKTKTGVPSPQIETPASHRRSIPAPPPHVAEKLVSLIRTIKPPLAGLLVVLAQLSVCLCCRPSWSNLSVPSVLGWRLFEIPAGCRPPLAFLPVQGGGINPQIQWLIAWEIKKGEKAAAADQAQQQRYRFTDLPSCVIFATS